MHQSGAYRYAPLLQFNDSWNTLAIYGPLVHFGASICTKIFTYMHQAMHQEWSMYCKFESGPCIEECCILMYCKSAARLEECCMHCKSAACIVRVLRVFKSAAS